MRHIVDHLWMASSYCTNITGIRNRTIVWK